MKVYTALIIGILFPFSIFSQTVVTASGGEGTGTGGTMSFTIGLPDYFEATGTGGTASLGVQQGYEYGPMWTGTTSIDWSVGSNWSKGVVPTSSDSAIIAAYPSNQPHITASVGSPTTIDNINVRNGASLTVDAGKALTVYENLNSDGTVLVEADASNIGSLITEGTISGSGDFKMEQYLTGTGGGTPTGLFWYTGSPITDATAATYNVSSGNRLWWADETTTSYPGITAGATALSPMTGYIARVGADGTFTFSGSAYNTGNISNTNITRTGTTANSRGYNLIANPYPSTLSWDNATRTNLRPTLWYRTHQGSTMTYDTYNAESHVGTNNNGNGEVTGDIPPTQAFWVRVPTDGQTGQLAFTDAMRSHTGWSSIYRLAAEEGTVRLSVSNADLSDETIILFNTDAQNGYDDFDSQKFWAGASVPQLYTTVGTDSLVINGLESIAANPIVDLGIKIPSQGEHTITATDITVVEDVYLEDRLLAVFQNLTLDPTYDFTEDAGNIPTRFALHFGITITDIDDSHTFRTQVFSSGNDVNIILSEEVENGMATVYDMAGKLIATEAINSTRNTFRLNTASGIYMVQVSSDKGTSTHKVLVISEK